MKRDDQVLVYRLQNEENRNRMARIARDKDRAMAHDGDATAPDAEVEGDETVAAEDGIPAGVIEGVEALGSKVIVIQPGSQFLRIGLASDVLPKTVPMVLARKVSSGQRQTRTEDTETSFEPQAKRQKTGDEEDGLSAVETNVSSLASSLL